MSVATRSQLHSIIQWLNRLAGWLLLLALIWLSWASAKLLWLLLAPPQAPMLPPAPLKPSMTAPVDYASNFMVFEPPAPTPVAAKPPPDVALKGVMLAEPQQNSAALLEVNGSVKNYRIGDTLDNSDYKLVAASWNEVILADPSDSQVVITLTEPMTLDQGEITAKTPAGQISNRRLPAQRDNRSSLAAQVAPNRSDGGDAKSSDPQSAISAAVLALKENPASYLSRMGVMATGEGYEVTDAMPSRLKNRLGLAPGDKVLAVNGQNVGSNPSQDASLLDQIKQSGEAQIEVQRGDQVITIRQQF